MHTITDAERVVELEEAVERLGHRLGTLEDVAAIRNLQHAYGYYLDKCLYDEVVDLFAETGEARFMGGVFQGKEGARRLYCERFRERFTGGYNGPMRGFLLDHPMMQDVVHVAPDRSSARARFRCLMQAGRHVSGPDAPDDLLGTPRQWWEGGVYENEYVREDGVWKFKVLDYRAVWHGTFDEGWSRMRPNVIPFYETTRPEDPLGPDALTDDPPHLWPDTDVVPFHYTHPVTGQAWTPAPPLA
jgi:hypothetical protein